MSSFEKRRFKRLPLALDLSCLKVGSTADKFHTGCTVNVSPGGLYFETIAEALEPGNLLKIELSIPPTAGLLELGGKISGFARVLRTCNIDEPDASTNLPFNKYGVALEFCKSLKLST